MKNFKIKKIKKDIYLITEPYFYEHANSYLIKGDEHDLLIDCGIGLSDMRGFLKKRGFNPKVFITHSHFDHAGGLKYFKSSEVFITAAILRNMGKKELQGLAYLKPEFFNSAQVQNMLHMRPAQFCLKYKIKLPSGTEPFKLKNLTVGKYSFQIIKMSGHTNDSTILYDRKYKILITGDTLYKGDIYADLPNSDKKSFLRSLYKIQKLNFELVLTGHNAVLNRAQGLAVIRQWIRKLKS